MEYGQPLDASGEAYLQMADYLASVGIRVPAVLDVDRAAGRVLLSDLGDVTLESLVLGRPEAAWRPLYGEAVDVLGLLQRAGRERPEPDRPCFHLRLDHARFLFELEFFREHFLEGYRGIALSAAAREELHAAFDALAADAAGQPLALCHRDYHSRNIMVKDGHLWLVDFQDARLGPRTYDLASLLRDAYVTLPGGLVEELAARFAAGHDAAAIRGELLVTGIQRNLKALGTFGFQIGQRGNARYVDAVDRTLAHLAHAMPLSPRHGELYRLLTPLLRLPPARPPGDLSGI